jgi:AraC-like DNA-binding protein
MARMSKCDCYKIVPVEFCEHEDFRDVRLDDRLFLCLISSGSVTLKLDGCLTFFIAPCIICLDDRCPVEYINSSSLSASSVYFSPVFLNVNMTFGRIRSEEYTDLADRHDFMLLLPFLRRTENYLGFIPLENDQFIMFGALMRRIGTTLNDYEDGRWSCRTRTSLMKIIFLLEEIYDEYTAARKPVYNIRSPQTYVSIVIGYIRTHYQGKIHMDDLCALVNVNRTTLLKSFKMITGMTISDFITGYRLNASLRSLEFTQLTIDEIAKEFGFNYASYFIRVFENEFHVSPSDYRQQKVSDRKAEFPVLTAGS